MPNDEIIVTNPKPKLALLPTGIVSHWRQVWKEYTSTLWLLVLASPDIYAGAMALGLLQADALPPVFAYTLRGLAVVGLAAKFVNQKKPEA